MSVQPIAPVTLSPLPGARRGMTSAWFEPPRETTAEVAADLLRRLGPPTVYPLRDAGHIGSALLLERPEWMAAMDRRWSPLEAWLRDEIAERKARDAALNARIAETVAALPLERPGAPAQASPAVVRRTGRFGRRVDPAPVLEGRAEEAMRSYEADAHAQYPDVDEPKTPGRHGRKRGLRLRRRQEAGQ